MIRLKDAISLLRIRFALWRLVRLIRRVERHDPAQGRWMRFEAAQRLAEQISDPHARASLLALVQKTASQEKE